MQSENGASASNSPAQPAVDNEPAGLLRRLAALAYDCVVLAGPIAVYGFLIVLLRRGVAVEPDTPWFTAGLLAVPGVFFCWFWTHGGQTLGMLAWRVHLVTLDGRAIGWGRAIARYCAAYVSVLPAGLGFIWALWDAERATWHDRLTGTRMVYRPSAKAAARRLSARARRRSS